MAFLISLITHVGTSLAKLSGALFRKYFEEEMKKAADNIVKLAPMVIILELEIAHCLAIKIAKEKEKYINECNKESQVIKYWKQEFKKFYKVFYKKVWKGGDNNKQLNQTYKRP